MSMEFKRYDKKYARFRGQALNMIRMDPEFCMFSDAEIDKNFRQWPQVLMQYVKGSFTKEEIAHAVYGSAGAELWQKFRVGLKGLTTAQKLFCLSWYLSKSVLQVRDKPVGKEQSRRRAMCDVIRVSNYIGALVRGGLLTADTLEVKEEINDMEQVK